jgi:hypothetical protein
MKRTVLGGAGLGGQCGAGDGQIMKREQLGEAANRNKIKNN